MYGVTIENVENSDQIINSIKSLSWKPTVRVVFQADESNPAYYKPFLQKLRPYANIMGQILDSEYMGSYSEAKFQKRVDDYVGQLDPLVDIWEIGNEINGSWLGDSATRGRDVGYAYDKVVAKGKPTAIVTWYDPPSCVDKDFEMIQWNKTYIPERVRNGVTYALVSYYGSSCTAYNKQKAKASMGWNNFEHLSATQWTAVMQNLRGVYPNAKLGFGEVGYQNDDSAFEGPGNKKFSDAEKVRLIKEYYGLQINLPNYVGGYFYWEGSQDLVPQGNPIWTGFNEALDLQAIASGDSGSTQTNPPTLNLTASSANLVAPANFSVTASSNMAGTTSITVNNNTIKTCSSVATCVADLTNYQAGTYNFVANISSSSGTNTASTTVTVKKATTPTNQPPSVSLKIDKTTAVAPASATLTATATDSDGSIAKVEFYNNSTLVGASTKAPYSLTLSNLGEGVYNYTAKATDNLGASSISGNIKFTVTPQTTTDPNGTSVWPTNTSLTLKFDGNNYPFWQGKGCDLGNCSIDLSWIGVLDRVNTSGYEIWRSSNNSTPIKIGNTGLSVTNFKDINVAKDIDYKYSVKAISKTNTSTNGPNQNGRVGCFPFIFQWCSLK